jgi:hypothetical protein
LVEFLTPSRVVQVEAPDGFRDSESWRRELAPFLFTFTGVVVRDVTEGLSRLIDDLAEAGIPEVDAESEMLVAWWDGRCERTKRWIADAGRRRIPAMVIRYQGEEGCEGRRS